MNYHQILKDIYNQIQITIEVGEVANYIPALQNCDPNDFAMSITLIDGTTYNIGNYNHKFSIQSISKVFAYTKALSLMNGRLNQRVGVEPSGDPFNSLIQLEHEEGIPRNPFINAGAIVITDILLSYYLDKDTSFDRFLQFVRNVSDNENIHFNEEVYKSEIQTGHRNIASAELMKSFGNIENQVSDVIESYFKHCSLEMSTSELSRSILFLANNGVDPLTKKEILTSQQASRVKAVMLTCGHYDASGDFAYHVGLPGKSGVGGGIVAVVPGIMSISVYSPRLNSWGNSYSGTKALDIFTNLTGYSIF